jgi:hypothetical protein
VSRLSGNNQTVITVSLPDGIMAVPATADQGYYMTPLGNMDLNINTSTSPVVQVDGPLDTHGSPPGNATVHTEGSEVSEMVIRTV